MIRPRVEKKSHPSEHTRLRVSVAEDEEDEEDVEGKDKGQGEGDGEGDGEEAGEGHIADGAVLRGPRHAAGPGGRRVGSAAG